MCVPPHLGGWGHRSPPAAPHVGLAPQGLTGHPRATKLCSWGWGGQGWSQSLSQGVLSPSLLAVPGLGSAAMETRLFANWARASWKGLTGSGTMATTSQDAWSQGPLTLLCHLSPLAVREVPGERELRGAGISSRTQQTRAGGQRRAEGLPHKPQRRAWASCEVCPGGHQPSSWGKERLEAWEQCPTLGAFPSQSKSCERAACKEPLTRQLPPRRLEPWCGRVGGCEGSSHSSHSPVPSPVGPLDGSPASTKCGVNPRAWLAVLTSGRRWAVWLQTPLCMEASAASCLGADGLPVS